MHSGLVEVGRGHLVGLTSQLSSSWASEQQHLPLLWAGWPLLAPWLPWQVGRPVAGGEGWTGKHTALGHPWACCAPLSFTPSSAPLHWFLPVNSDLRLSTGDVPRSQVSWVSAES